jgi:hypothetical protein
VKELKIEAREEQFQITCTTNPMTKTKKRIWQFLCLGNWNLELLFIWNLVLGI